MLISILIFIRLAAHRRDLPPLCLIQLLSRVELHLCSVAQVLIGLTLCQWRQTTTPQSENPEWLAHNQQRVNNYNQRGILLICLWQYAQQTGSIYNTASEGDREVSPLVTQRGNKRYRKWGRERLQALTCTQQRQDVDTQTVSSEPNHLRCVYPFLKGY